MLHPRSQPIKRFQEVSTAPEPAHLAALAEHLAARDGKAAPAWTEHRSLRQFWFPFNTRAARVDAVVHAPAAFRKRGVYVAARNLEVA